MELQVGSREPLYQIMLARYYSSSLARFMAVDPSGDSVDHPNPQSWNRYVYALNNPIAFRDPDGQAPDSVVMIRFHQQVTSQFTPSTTTVMAGGKIHAGTGAAVYGGISFDSKGNIALIGKVSFTVGPGVLIQGGVEASISPGGVYDFSPQSEQISLDVNAGPGGGASLDDSGVPSGGIGPGEVSGNGLTVRLSGGKGVALTHDFTHTGAIPIAGSPPPTQSAPRPAGGPVMNPVGGTGGPQGLTSVDRKIADYKARAARGPEKKK